MSQPVCETTGHPILFCGCEVHDPPSPICEWSGLMRISCPPECPEHGDGWSGATPAEQLVMAGMIEPVHHITNLEQVAGKPLPSYRVINLDQPKDERRTPEQVKRPSRNQPRESPADRAQRQLMELPDEIAMLPDVLTGAGGEPERGGKREHPPIPIRAAVADLLDQRAKPWHSTPTRTHDRHGEVADDKLQDPDAPSTILAELAMWVRAAAEDMDQQGVERTPAANPPTITTETDWLLRHWVWITGAEWADELYRSIGRMLREVWLAMAEKPEYLPRCDKCGNRLVPMLGTREALYGEAPDWFRCSKCGQAINHLAAIKRIAELQPPMTIKNLSVAVDVPIKTLHDWHKRGMLTPTGASKDGKLFDPYQARKVKATLRHGPNKETA